MLSLSVRHTPTTQRMHIVFMLLKLHDRFVKQRVFPDSQGWVEMFAVLARILSAYVREAWYFPPQLW